MGLLVPLFIIAAVAIVVVGFYMSAQRRKELSAWAVTNGLSFSSGNDRGMENRFSDFDCLRQGHSRYAYNVMSGMWTEPGDEARFSVCAFDYHYETGSGKNHHTYTFSAVVVASPIPLRPLFIRPEGFFDKVSEFFGADDIDFESAEFSREFYVKSPDKRWAYDVIHQRMMEFLMGEPRFHIQFSTRHIMAWRSSTFSAAEFGSAVRLIRGMLERMPGYVVRQQTEGG